MKRKLLSLLLVLAMVITLFPVAAFASDDQVVSGTTLGDLKYEIMEDGNYHIETYPAVFNTETGKTVIIKDYGERVVSHITNDGIVCIANSSYLPNDGFMYDVNTQTNLGSVQEWILSTYGIIAPMGYIRHVSPDGQYLMAHTMEDSALQPRVVGWYLAPALEK